MTVTHEQSEAALRVDVWLDMPVDPAELLEEIESLTQERAERGPEA